MLKCVNFLLLFWLLQLGFGSTHALAQTPPALEKWKSWILDSHPNHRCTSVAFKLDTKICAWPSALKLEIDDKRARFTHRWRLEKEGNITLPGSKQLWPMDVTVNDKPAKVLIYNNKPTIKIGPGTHRIQGVIHWSTPPQQIPLPDGTYHVRLFRDNAQVEAPFISKQGQLWLSRREATETNERNSVVIEVFRSIQDTVPRRILTEVHLSVSGTPRELLAGALRLPTTETEWFRSPLPAKLEADGNLRVQVRSGKWTISHLSRFIGDVNTMGTAPQTDNWPKQELWGFQPNLTLRRVKVSGAPQVDGKQIEYPNILDEQALYLLDSNNILNLEEIDRGMSVTATPKLNLERKIWPNIESDGAVIEDNIRGNVRGIWRLDSDDSFELGRVEVNSDPVVVTQLSQDSGAGFELQESAVVIQTAASLDFLSKLTTSGWQTYFGKVTHDLNLPPTWRIWHVSGPDKVTGSWLAKWDLWSIFLCLLVVGAVARLLGWPSAIIAIAAGALHYHSPSAAYLWALPLLMFIPLLRVLPINIFRLLIQVTTLIFMGLTALALIQFSVSHIRGIIYPQLAPKVHAAPYQTSSTFKESPQIAQKSEPVRSRIATEADFIEKVTVTGVKSSASSTYFNSKKIMDRETVQTGPGIPNWRWDNIRYSWTGPVATDQPLKLWHTKGWLTRVIAVVEWIFVLGLFFMLMRTLTSSLGRIARTDKTATEAKLNSTNAASTLTLFILFMLVSGQSDPVQAQIFPSEPLLKEYEKRLLKKPSCAPNCYTINKGQILVDHDKIRIDLSIASDAEIAVPLPSSDKWTAITITSNGKTVPYISRIQNADYIKLTQGVFNIRMIGRLQSDKFTLSFPKNSFNIRVLADDKHWLTSGTRETYLVGNALSFEKKEKKTVQNTLIQEPANNFVKVRRKLTLGSTWVIETKVARVAPVSGAITMAIPLLPGEQILSQNIVVEDNRAVVQLGGNQKILSWRSQMEPVDTLILKHTKTASWAEKWSVVFSPRWHLSYEGLIPVNDSTEEREWVWEAWPGESVKLNIARPKAIDGRNITVNKVGLNSSPGLRITDHSLQLTIQSSLGEPYKITLPESSELKGVQINGQEVPSRAIDNILSLPLRPGKNTLQIQWRNPIGLDTLFSTPKIQLQTPSRNIDLKVALPNHRWPLFLGGPQQGPAVLFWSTLGIILLMAIALGWVRKRFAPTMPLSTSALILLGLGISTAWKVGGILFIAWFVILELRKRYGSSLKQLAFNFLQLGLVLLSVMVFISLFANVPYGLLAEPNMGITGNASYKYSYNWYADSANETLPQAKVLSVSIWFYRLAMLAWSLWLVFALLNWVRWGWQCFSNGHLWQLQADNPEPKP